MYICIHVYVHIHACMHACIHTYIHACIHNIIYNVIYIYIYIYIPPLEAIQFIQPAQTKPYSGDRRRGMGCDIHRAAADLPKSNTLMIMMIIDVYCYY